MMIVVLASGTKSPEWPVGEHHCWTASSPNGQWVEEVLVKEELMVASWTRGRER